MSSSATHRLFHADITICHHGFENSQVRTSVTATRNIATHQDFQPSKVSESDRPNAPTDAAGEYARSFACTGKTSLAHIDIDDMTLVADHQENILVKLFSDSPLLVWNDVQSVSLVAVNSYSFHVPSNNPSISKSEIVLSSLGFQERYRLSSSKQEPDPLASGLLSERDVPMFMFSITVPSESIPQSCNASTSSGTVSVEWHLFVRLHFSSSRLVSPGILSSRTDSGMYADSPPWGIRVTHPSQPCTSSVPHQQTSNLDVIQIEAKSAAKYFSMIPEGQISLSATILQRNLSCESVMLLRGRIESKASSPITLTKYRMIQELFWTSSSCHPQFPSKRNSMLRPWMSLKPLRVLGKSSADVILPISLSPGCAELQDSSARLLLEYTGCSHPNHKSLPRVRVWIQFHVQMSHFSTKLTGLLICPKTQAKPLQTPLLSAGRVAHVHAENSPIPTGSFSMPMLSTFSVMAQQQELHGNVEGQQNSLGPFAVSEYTTKQPVQTSLHTMMPESIRHHNAADRKLTESFQNLNPSLSKTIDHSAFLPAPSNNHYQPPFSVGVRNTFNIGPPVGLGGAGFGNSTVLSSPANTNAQPSFAVSQSTLGLSFDSHMSASSTYRKGSIHSWALAHGMKGVSSTAVAQGDRSSSLYDPFAALRPPKRIAVPLQSVGEESSFKPALPSDNPGRSTIDGHNLSSNDGVSAFAKGFPTSQSNWHTVAGSLGKSFDAAAKTMSSAIGHGAQGANCSRRGNTELKVTPDSSQGNQIGPSVGVVF